MNRARVIALVILFTTITAAVSFAQERRAPAKPGPWFGVPLPPPLGQDPAVIVGDRAPRPVVLPNGEAASP